MARFLLLKHYRGGPEAPGFAPMNEWTEDERQAHFQFQRDTCAMLQERGEFVDAQGISADGEWVQYGGPGAAPKVIDGPFPETKELIAGWFFIDVESKERAHEVAAHASSAPGRGGKPIYEWLEVRQILEAPPAAD